MTVWAISQSYIINVFSYRVSTAFSTRAKRGYLYYTASAKQLFMRVKVDPTSCNPVGEVEVVGGGRF
jgi:hypothetical protein